MSYETEKLAELAGRRPASKRVLGYKPPVAPAYVYLLAEHLDTVLAAGEDLQAHHITWKAESPRFTDKCENERVHLRHTLASLRTLELALIGRLMRARAHAETLSQSQGDFRVMAQLFLAGTTPFVDAVAELGQTEKRSFDDGGDGIAYIRNRGLIAPDAGAPLDGTRIDIGEEFLVAKRIALGVLMDLVAMFLDTLEIHYTLFDDPAAAASEDAEDSAAIEAVVDTQTEFDEHADALAMAVAAARAALAAETSAETAIDSEEVVESVEASAEESTQTSDAEPWTEEVEIEIPTQPEACAEAEPDAAEAAVESDVGDELAIERESGEVTESSAEESTQTSDAEPSTEEVEIVPTQPDERTETELNAAEAVSEIEAEAGVTADNGIVTATHEPNDAPVDLEAAPKVVSESVVAIEAGEIESEETEAAQSPDIEAEPETEAAGYPDLEVEVEASPAAEPELETSVAEDEAAAETDPIELDAGPSEPPPLPADHAGDGDTDVTADGEEATEAVEEDEEDGKTPVRMSLAEAIAAVRDGKAS